MAVAGVVLFWAAAHDSRGQQALKYPLLCAHISLARLCLLTQHDRYGPTTMAWELQGHLTKQGALRPRYEQPAQACGTCRLADRRVRCLWSALCGHILKLEHPIKGARSALALGHWQLGPPCRRRADLGSNAISRPGICFREVE